MYKNKDIIELHTLILSRIYHNQFYTFTCKIHNEQHNSGPRSSSTHSTATIRVKVQPPRCVPAASSFWCFKSARCSADSASIESNTSTGRFSLIAFPTSPCWCVGCWTTVDLKTKNEKIWKEFQWTYNTNQHNQQSILLNPCGEQGPVINLAELHI